MEISNATGEIIKKRRRQNFSDREVNMLVTEVEANLDIIQCKLSSSISIANKQKVWQSITERINSTNGGVIRCKEEVKRKWHDLVSVTRKKEAGRQREIRGTGGGTQPPALTDLEEKILSMIPPVMVEGIIGGIESIVPGVNHALEAGAALDNEKQIESAQHEPEPSTSEDPIIQDVWITPTVADVHSRPTTTKPLCQRKRPAKPEIRGASGGESLVEIEREKLQLERERMAWFKRSVVAQERLVEVEMEKLSLLRKDQTPSTPTSQISPIIKFF